MPADKNNPFVLQHDHRGTIHFFKNGNKGDTLCGKGKNDVDAYTRKRLSKAFTHDSAHICGTTKKCGRVDIAGG